MIALATCMAPQPFGQVQQREVAGRAFNDGSDGRVRGDRALNQVTFVVAGHEPALDLLWTVVDRYRVRDATAILFAATPFSD